MLAIAAPRGITKPVASFLSGWSTCMAAFSFFSEKDRKTVKDLFDKYLIPEAHCQEAKDLDAALMKYIMHKCESKQGIGNSRARVLAAGRSSCPRCQVPVGELHKSECEEGHMQLMATQRPKDHNNLSPQDQWSIDKELGILDWEGY